MPAKKLPPKTTGAPANAALLESHASDAESEVVKIKAERTRLQALVAQFDGAPEKQKPYVEALADIPSQLEKAYDLWFKLSKQVLDYDKKVDLSRREGEMVPALEAKEFFAQFHLSITLAIESYIISLSQDATRAESPEQFYQAHADNLRSCMTSAVEKAQKDNKLPKWALIE